VQRLIYHLSVYLGHDSLAHTQVSVEPNRQASR
jgi:hypothetical protein